MTSSGTHVPVEPPAPIKPEGLESRPRDEDRLTRKPMPMWDRIKFMLLLGGVWGVLLWARLVDNPILPFEDAVRDAVYDKWWLLALIGVEALRQLHYMISESSAGYHRFWTKGVFGGLETRTHKINDWNRFRIARVVRIVVLISLVGVVLGALQNQPAVTALFELPGTIWDAMPMIIQVVFIMAISIMQFVAIFWFMSKGGVDVYYPDDIKTRFSDVWGQDGVLARVKENVLFLEHPERIEAKGGHVPTGILLWGPPGTGKTLMAEAVAGETGKPYVFVDPGAFNAMFFGVGILKVKALFRKLRRLAVRYGGVIVFFDEADSLGSRGQLTQGGAFGFGPTPSTIAPGCNGSAYMSATAASLLSTVQSGNGPAEDGPRPGMRNRFVVGGGGGGGMGTLQALLTELSGLKKPRGFFNRHVRKALGMRPKPPPKYRILVMMATNMPQALDEALLRPGRIDRIYKVGYPAKPGRVRTYEGYFAKVKHRLTADDIDKLAIMTPYATGATIKDLVNEALIVAIRDGRDEITWADVLRAKQLKALGPSEDFEYIERERHSVAVHEACHAVAAYRVRHHYVIDLATIERRGQVGGFVSSIPPEDRFVHWRSEYEADIIVALASLAGERLFFRGDNSAGVSGDLEAATEVATMMEGYLGMGSTVSVHGVTHRAGIGSGGRRGDGKEANPAEQVSIGLGDRIEKNLGDLLERTTDLLRENHTQVLAVAHALETYQTMDGDDVAAVMEYRQGPLVDGRVYAGEAFKQAIEKYHDAAVIAHQKHSKDALALPVLNGHLPDAEGAVVLDVTAVDVTVANGAPGAAPEAGEPATPAGPSAQGHVDVPESGAPPAPVVPDATTPSAPPNGDAPTGGLGA